MPATSASPFSVGSKGGTRPVLAFLRMKAAACSIHPVIDSSLEEIGAIGLDQASRIHARSVHVGVHPLMHNPA
jgi:hypothetical protein